MRTLWWGLGCVWMLGACDSAADASSDAGRDASDDAMQMADAGELDVATVDVRTEGDLRIVTFTTAAFVVAPFEERYVCQNFANPLDADVVIVKSKSTMAAGSHHMFAFQQSVSGGPIGALEDCSGLEFGSSAHSAQVPERTLEYPEGIARAWSSDDGIRIQAHYLNVTAEPITARIVVELHTSDGSDFVLSSSIFFNNLAINVAPGAMGSAERTCTLPQDVELMNAISHMHRFATHFVATLDDGTVLYETDDWSEPETQAFDPPLHLPAGTRITFRCEYQNTSNETLTFGESARTNEMCIFGGQFYPAPSGGITCM